MEKKGRQRRRQEVRKDGRTQLLKGRPCLESPDCRSLRLGQRFRTRVSASITSHTMSNKLSHEAVSDVRKSVSSNFCEVKVNGPEGRTLMPSNATLSASISVPALNSCYNANRENLWRASQSDPRRGTTVAIPTIDPNRETWRTSTDFLLSVIGFAVDLANVSTNLLNI